jgi:DNA-binding XRE family transcriptional regulator
MIKFRGNKLKALLAESKVTQTQLAKELGLHRNSVYQWCNGKSVPEVGMVLNILYILGYRPQNIWENKKFWDLYD